MSHLKFNIIEDKPKTKVYDVVSEHDLTFLGRIYWYGAWRQYVFEPNRDVPTIWSDDCINELYKFIHKLKESRKGIISIDAKDGKVLGIKKNV